MSQVCAGGRLLSTLTLLGALACGKGDAGPATKGAEGTAPVPAAEAKPQPYTYPAPVSGHYKEGNSGEFDLVDGLAWGPTRAGETAIYVTDKLIASPVLGTTCPMAEARALSVLRNARWNAVNLDAKGKSRYYGAGTQYDGTSRSEDVGSHDWKFARRDVAEGRIAGKVTNRYYGSFEFDLPVRKPAVPEVSEIERMDGGLSKPDMPAPDAAAVSATFAKIRSAALAKDLKGWLAAQGFSAEQIAAIRGLAGIDADLEQHALHFLSPEMPKEAEETEMHPGEGYVRAEGANSAGAKFINYYYLVPCGDRLLLGMVGENPQ
ncbi:MAG: hypothetical protein KBA72_07905 [Thermoanaerobaculia bacterium]|nr:hypothetical protein [Thermoanaerobaculia bacterium]